VVPDDYLVSAALLRRGQDAPTLVADLAARLERALPDHVTVRRTGWGRRKQVRSLTIDLAPDRFRIEVENSGPVPWIDQIVRGICLRSDEVTMDNWLDRLAQTLNKEAKKSLDNRLAIQDALR
jgi:hypothetical protein